MSCCSFSLIQIIIIFIIPVTMNSVLPRGNFKTMESLIYFSLPTPLCITCRPHLCTASPPWWGSSAETRLSRPACHGGSSSHWSPRWRRRLQPCSCRQRRRKSGCTWQRSISSWMLCYRCLWRLSWWLPIIRSVCSAGRIQPEAPGATLAQRDFFMHICDVVITELTWSHIAEEEQKPRMLSFISTFSLWRGIWIFHSLKNNICVKLLTGHTFKVASINQYFIKPTWNR